MTFKNTWKYSFSSPAFHNQLRFHKQQKKPTPHFYCFLKYFLTPIGDIEIGVEILERHYIYNRGAIKGRIVK